MLSIDTLLSRVPPPAVTPSRKGSKTMKIIAFGDINDYLEVQLQ